MKKMYILIIAVRKIKHACIHNLQQMSNVDFQEDYLCQNDQFWLLLEILENFEQIQSKFTKISWNTSSFDKHKFLLYLLQKRASKT